MTLMVRSLRRTEPAYLHEKRVKQIVECLGDKLMNLKEI